MYADLKSEPIRLLLRPAEAAEALAISERTLWGLTRDGKIPSLRVGRCLRYDHAALRRWVDSRQSVAKG